ncbi:MarR family winged helix-turn-helix transcriptional regulator [Ottowia thiooxydans]|uniref:MarR family winged helix-turn-helix transcriptional regulator n=1 Tax=Ottowia thiooxydans TaxID=219182 RepID=UPI0004238A87|nr:MarR family transcriptional regulator [Ottowia thiooxydans]
MLTRNQLQTLQAARRQGIGRLLLLARRDFLDRLADRMANDAFVMSHANEHKAVMSQASGRLLPFIDLDGTRSVDLARRMGVSKQAIGRLVKELEEAGLLHREPDGADKRAFLVKFTEPGLDYLRCMHASIQRIEDEYTEIVGAERMQSLRESLSQIAYGEEK